jgi:hypothetical protein
LVIPDFGPGRDEVKVPNPGFFSRRRRPPYLGLNCGGINQPAKGRRMNASKKILVVAVLGAMSALLSACSAEVGSKEWCADMDAKAKGEWTANEASDYAKHCLLK